MDELEPSGLLPATAEGKSVMHKVTMLSGRIHYYLRLYPVAVEMYDRLMDRRTKGNPTGAVTYWVADTWNQPKG
jgi:hypothetical protein